MKIQNRTWLIIFVSALLVAASIINYRWVALNNQALVSGIETADSTLSELRQLKRKIDKFKTVSHTLNEDITLQKQYLEKTLNYRNQFDREGVEKIIDVLNTIYTDNSFFELTSLSIKHQNTRKKEEIPQILFNIEGEKRLVQP